MSTLVRSQDFDTQNDYVKYYLTVEYGDGDVDTNTTPITVRGYVYRTNTYRPGTWGTVDFSCNIGTETRSKQTYFPKEDAITERGKQIFGVGNEGDYTITHDADGTKTISITATFYINARAFPLCTGKMR